MDKSYRTSAGVIVCLFTGAIFAAGQQPPPAMPLRIVALQGNQAINYIPIGMVTAPVVEVRDENDRPVEGASVVFKLPQSGAGALFDNGQLVETTITDYRGQAGPKAYTVNNIAGQFAIEVTARYENRVGSARIVQVNSMATTPELAADKRRGKSKWIWMSVAAGAGAGLGLYFGLRGDSTPIQVSTGPVTVGGPR